MEAERGALPSVNEVKAIFAATDWFERPIAEGAVWRYYQFDDLYGGPQSISYVLIDQSEPGTGFEVAYLASTRQRTSTFVPAQFPNAVAAINGTFFDTSAGGGGSTTFLRVDGVDVTPPTNSGWSTQAGAAHDNNGIGDVAIRPASGNWAEETVNTSIAANGPTLLDGGAVPSFAEPGGFCSNRHPRTVVGKQADGDMVLLTIDGRTDFASGMSCPELALTLQALDCTEGANLDGGGSTTLWIADEPNNGVVNYPSDNGTYDHAGERSCSNAYVFLGNEVEAPLAMDARVTSIEYVAQMTEGATQEVTVTWQNIGTADWETGDVLFQTSRATGHQSAFASGSWVSPSQPGPVGAVQAGASVSVTFSLTAPAVDTATRFVENFALFATDTGDRFGPADNAVRLILDVVPEFTPGEPVDVIVESRADGLNFIYFAEQGGWGDSSATVTAAGCIGTGTRYGSTYQSVAGLKSATFTPPLPASGRWRVFVAWPAAGARRDNITFKVRHGVEENAGSVEEHILDQRGTANVWTELGIYDFPLGPDGAQVTISNENADESGNMYAGAVKWAFVEAFAADDGDHLKTY